MGYDAYDFFSEQVLPHLQKLNEPENPEETSLDAFLEIIKKSISEGFSSSGSERFKQILLATILDAENNPIERTVGDMFVSLYQDDAALRKFEYESNGAIITVDFDKFSKEKEQSE
jgi:hypothetical protein